ncbi:MAG: hypothetical protein IJ143_06820 [Neisseriaceae bacterium]|nr:hypothetical protein [Neisseriaceae bacterium]
METFNTIIHAVSLIVAIYGLYVAVMVNFFYKQLIETQNYLAKFRELNLVELLADDDLCFRKTDDTALSLEIIKRKVENAEGNITKVGNQLFDALNFYESVVRGVDMGLYHEGTVMKWGKITMIRRTKRYMEYIEYRRKTKENAWIELTNWVKRKELEEIKSSGGKKFFRFWHFYRNV